MRENVCGQNHHFLYIDIHVWIYFICTYIHLRAIYHGYLCIYSYFSLLHCRNMYIPAWFFPGMKSLILGDFGGFCCTILFKLGNLYVAKYPRISYGVGGGCAKKK